MARGLYNAHMKTVWVFGLILHTFLIAAQVEEKPLPVPTEGRTGYLRLTPQQTGLSPKGIYRPLENVPIRETGHSGLAAGDVNGDGLVDLFVCGMEEANALYLNRGNWKFEDVAESAGVACRGWRLSGAVLVDVDGDGDLDLTLTSLLDGRNFMYLNDGKGRFTENLKVGWIYNPRGGTVSTSFADVDGDGDLDMYTTGFVKIFLNEELEMETALKIQKMGLDALQNKRLLPELFWEYYDIDPKDHIQGLQKGEDAVPQMRPAYIEDHLYLNDGTGGFRAVADRERRFVDYNGRTLKRPRDPSHEAIFRDVDGDGDPDLYVTADFANPDRLWLNDGRGYFRQAHPLAMRRTSQFSMGLDFTDVNRDGHLDFLTADMLSRSHKRRKTQMGDMQVTESGIGLIQNRPQIMQNTLQLGRGDGTWAEVAQLSGLKATEWSWGVSFSDVDLDGYEDLIVATGMTRDFMDSDTQGRITETGRDSNKLEDLLLTREWFPKLPTQNVVMRNQGDLTFKYKSKDWGFSAEAVSGGLVHADFDGDGDLDLIFNNWTDPLEIYQNETAAARIAVRLVGHGANSQAIGAKVRLLGGPGGPKPMEHEIVCGGGYASSSENLIVFGTADKTEGLALEIIWRRADGTLLKTDVSNVQPNHQYTIHEPATGEPYQIPKPALRLPLFESADDLLYIQHPDDPTLEARVKHNELPFDDFAYQSLLPNRLSQLGPGVAWADLNADGRDDLVIGSGRGGELLIHLSGESGQFEGRMGPRNALDLAGVLVWPSANGKARILAGQSNYEQPDKAFAQPAAVRGFELGDTLSPTGFTLPGSPSTTGPLASADVDGDGDLDLFVGGRTVAARYPEPADSFLYLNQNGELKPDPVNNPAFKKLGLVSGAVFGDLDLDGDSDLVLALEWGPVMVLRNDAGKFTDATKAFGLHRHKGWWNSVALGDLNGDGRLDIVAGNWGRNSKYEYSYTFEEPLRVTYSDFDKNGVVDIVEYHRDKLTGEMVPERGRSCSTRAMPFIGQRNESFELFGSRTLEQVYGECLKEGKVLEANVLEHTVFLSSSTGQFTAQPLPIEAQFAPVFGLNIADFNGDGKEDLFIAQNFFASQRETPRSDGGRGLLMLGDGAGMLEVVRGTESGLTIYGEQRGSAVSDFNLDGRVDLVVTQNGALTRLYRNREAKPGLRVKVNAGPANPTGVGAQVRLVFTDGTKGAVRPITAGSGYWSQDSATQVLGYKKPVQHLEIRWPDGQVTQKPVEKDAKEITVERDSKTAAR